MLKDISPDWWGFKYGFVSGGFLGAESRRKLKNGNLQERTAFHEDDQENLYKLVQVSTHLIQRKRVSILCHVNNEILGNNYTAYEMISHFSYRVSTGILGKECMDVLIL